jgi:ankyrin repeat protein
MVRTLLTKDRLYSSDDNGSSPLHIAIQEGCPIATVRAILTLGARTSALDYEGRTPLRVAVDIRNWEAAKLLADAGSDVFLSARDGQSPADVVLSLGEDPIHTLFSGSAVNSRDASGNTILHYAAKIGDTTIIRQLIDLGANKGTQNTSAESPADIAQRWKHLEAATLLN